MASKTSLGLKIPSASPDPLPSFPQGALMGPQKAADTAMKNIQREQAQLSVPAPALSSARVEMSAADELDSLLSEAFDEYVPTPDSPVQTASAPTLEQPAPLFELNLTDLQPLIFDIMTLPLREQINISALQQDEISLIGKRLNACLQQLNRFFEKMQQQGKTLKTWVEENQEFFNCHPMAASHYLTLYLEKSRLLAPHLDRDQLAAWNQNYPKCILMLKLNSLDSFVETEFPFDKSLKAQVEEAKKCYDNPQLLEEFAKASGNPSFPPLIFFQNLNHLLDEHPQDNRAIDAWLQSELAKADYGHYFYYVKDMHTLPFMKDDPSGKELKKLYESCAARLKALGLGHYCDETLPPELAAQRKSQFAANKEYYKKMGKECLSVLKPLSEILRKISAEPAAVETHRKTVEEWFSNFKANRNYEYPFFFVPMLLAQRPFLTDALNEAEIQELERLHKYCRDQLFTLNLDVYLNEAPGKPAAEKRKITLLERFKKETEFFQKLLKQDEKTLVAWLTENSPQNDYPLLWGKKRSSRLDNYRESVDFALRTEWQTSFDACQAKLTALGLQSHLNTDLIPANTSRQLRVFVNPQDPILFMDFGDEPEGKYQVLLREIEEAIQNPLAPSSYELNRHFRFYLTKYPQIVEKVIPADLLARWKAAFSGSSEEPPSLPDEATLQTAINFYMTFLRKSKESNDSALRWLDEQKAGAIYAFPFYQFLYLQTLANTDDHPKLKMLAECHKKAVDWAHQTEQKPRLLETPAGPQGVWLLVHRLTEHLMKPSFTAVIVKLVPRMAPLLAKKEMFTFWENHLVNRATNMFSMRIEVYLDLQTRRTKEDIITFINMPKQYGVDKLDLLSKDYVQLVDQLTPILPPSLPVAWKQAYEACCKFIRAHGIPDQDYIDVPACAFFSEDKNSLRQRFEHQFKTVSSFFKALEREKDPKKVKGEIEKKRKESPLLTPFWFAREIDDLLIGYDVKLARKELKEFKEVFGRIQEKLKGLHLESFLAEPPPKDA